VYNPFETKLFPNPTNGPSNFSIFVNEPAQFQIEIYSISGQKINELHKGELSEGRHQFDIDLSNYNTGTYLIKVWSEKQEETIKLIKVE
jgi:flagellar hook assembly protein FlgD